MGDTREQYIRELDSRIRKWRDEIQRLLDRAQEAEAEAAMALNDKVRRLQVRLDDMDARIEGIRKAGDEAWQTVRAEIDAAWDELQQAFEDLFQSPEGGGA